MKRSVLLASFVIVILTTLGISAAQGDGGYYYRFFASSPLTVTCSTSGVAMDFHVNGSLGVEYNLPAHGAHVVDQLFDNGPTAFIYDNPYSGSSHTYIGYSGSVPDANPLNIAVREQTFIGSQMIYSSTLSFTCAGDGTFPVSIVNEGTLKAGFIDDGRINPQNFAPVALYCDNTVLTAYAIDTAGRGQKAWTFDLKNASSNKPLMDQDGITLSKTAEGRDYVLAPQHDGKNYLFVFDGCPSPGTTEVYVSDPVSGAFVQTN